MKFIKLFQCYAVLAAFTASFGAFGGMLKGAVDVSDDPKLKNLKGSNNPARDYVSNVHYIINFILRSGLRGALYCSPQVIYPAAMASSFFQKSSGAKGDQPAVQDMNNSCKYS